ncbi:NTF2 fold immunity protein [Pseudomonas sp. S37]|uniref:NTF2 fold immunity protein n=1 Tax=Pseudomonas sp. S37 TaxID=2767449 RepID=UPI001913AA05
MPVPPEYDQDVLEDTLETSGSKTLICTHNKKSLLPHRRYTLTMKDGKSRIDRVEGRISADDDWRKINSI